MSRYVEEMVTCMPDWLRHPWRTFMKKLAKRLMNSPFGQTALQHAPIDLSVFKQRPGPLLITGLILLAASYIVGWPMIAACSFVAIHFEDPLIFAIGGPALYGLSWLVFSVALIFIGKESYQHLHVLTEYLVVRLIEKHGEPDQLNSSPNDSSSSTQDASTASSDSE